MVDMTDSEESGISEPPSTLYFSHGVKTVLFNSVDVLLTVFQPSNSSYRFVLFFSAMFVLLAGIGIIGLLVSFQVHSSSIDGIHSERKDFRRSNERMLGSAFTCSGVCYCYGEKDRRMSVEAYSKSFFLPITAISITLALKYAKERFKYQCLSRYSQECDGTIDQNVEFCESVEENNDYDVVTLADENFVDMVKDYEEEYECFGHCVKNGYLLKDQTRPEAREIVENYECEKMTAKGTVRVKIPRVGGKYFQKYNQETRKYESTSEGRTPRLNEVARQRFQKEYLTLYCKKESIVTYSFMYEYPSGRRMKRKRTTSMCRAMNKTSGGVLLGNPLQNVKCKKIREFRTDEPG